MFYPPCDEKYSMERIYIYINVTFQKSAFAVFIPQLKRSTFLVWFPFWILTTVRIKTPVGCTYGAALFLATSVVAFSPLLHLH